MENTMKPIKVYRLRYVFELRNGYTPSKNELSYWSGGTIPWFRMEDIRKNGRILSDSIQHITSKAIKGGGLFSANSFILATTATIGEHALLIADSLANQRFTNLKVRKSLIDKFDIKFLFYYMYKIGEWCKNSVNTTCFSSVNIDELKSQMIPLFTLSDQKAIAVYLDKATAEIDKAIAQQQRMIDLLNERKQIIIQRAVTKGLDENVEMKDSGIEWIGEIPVHWEVCKLKYLFKRIADGTHFSPKSIDDGYPYLTAADVRGIGINYESTKKISAKDYHNLVSTGCKAFEGDILIVKDGATTGRVGLKTDNVECVTLSSVAMLTPIDIESTYYLMYMMMSDSMQKQISFSMSGAAMPRITLVKLNNFYAIKPPILEQKAIVEFIKSRLEPVDVAIERLEKLISLLQERKQIIISEAVTGKIKVS